MEPAKTFRDGFGWPSVIGALFCGFLMVPGSIYLQLMVGQSMGPAATWVTVILFMEVARRALRKLHQSEIVILLMVAGSMAGAGGMSMFGDLIWRRFLTTSSAAQDAGLAADDSFPNWWIPDPGAEALTGRSFLDPDWLIPVGLMVGLMVVGTVSNYCMGYVFFRLVSDVEKLPFPMAPVDAAGTLALVEGESGEHSWRWTVFSTGAMIGIGFGAVYVLVPAITGVMFAKPVTLLPIPWLELTPLTQKLLPAVAFGITIELGLVLVGMVLPFWAVMGTGAAIAATMILNPVLYKTGILHQWQPGMDTINTMYANHMDFWFSAGLGVTFGLAFVSILQTIMSVRRARRERRLEIEGALLEGAKIDSAGDQIDGEGEASIFSTKGLPKGRGDFNILWAIGLYVFTSVIILILCWFLLPNFRHMMWLLAIMVFIYNPLISYVSARILAIAGQGVDIPFVREGIIMLSGYKGADIWAAPIPISNYGGAAQQFRTFELIGTSFWSIVKVYILILPLSLFVSFLFWSYIWHSAEIPSAAFPYAQKMWELNARNSILMFTSTTGEAGGQTMFEKAWNWNYLFSGAGACVVAFTLMSWLRLPTMAIYGFVRGMGGVPHGFVLEVVGALIAKFYLHKRFGKERFLRAAPVLLAGYGAGMGLVGMLGAAVALISSSVSKGVF